ACATLAVGRAWSHREVAVSGDGGEARVAVARVAAGFAGPLVRVLVVWWGLLTVAVVGAGFLVALPAAADAATTTTIVNFDAAGPVCSAAVRLLPPACGVQRRHRSVRVVGQRLRQRQRLSRVHRRVADRAVHGGGRTGAGGAGYGWRVQQRRHGRVRRRRRQ